MPVITAAYLGLVGCGREEGGNPTQGAGRVPAVAVEGARTEPISRLLDLTGETVAVDAVTIAATVEGPIRYCPWREGDRVETAPGEPTILVEIDREMYRAEVRAAEAALEVARAKLEDMKAGTRPEEIAKAAETVWQLQESAAFARNDLERIAQLVASGSLPAEVLEKAQVEYVTQQTKLTAAERHFEMLEAGFTRTAIAVQEAMVKESQARLELARARLNECIITAPFSGTITRVYVRPGDMAAVKAPLLEMADLSSLVVRVAVPEAHAAEMRPGMTARIVLDALPGKTFEGKVARVYPDLDRRMRTRTVELSLDEQAAVLPGMFARVRLVLAKAESAITIPQQAVVRTPAGMPTVFVADDGKAVQRKIKTGIEQAGRVQVVEGLSEGDRVIVAGHERIRDGAAVRVTEPAGKSPGKPPAPSGGEAIKKEAR